MKVNTVAHRAVAPLRDSRLPVKEQQGYNEHLLNLERGLLGWMSLTFIVLK